MKFEFINGFLIVIVCYFICKLCFSNLWLDLCAHFNQTSYAMSDQNVRLHLMLLRATKVNFLKQRNYFFIDQVFKLYVQPLHIAKWRKYNLYFLK